MKLIMENWKKYLNEDEDAVEETSEEEIWEKIGMLIEAGSVEMAVNMIETLELKASPDHPIFQVINKNRHVLGNGAWRLIMALNKPPEKMDMRGYGQIFSDDL